MRGLTSRHRMRLAAWLARRVVRDALGTCRICGATPAHIPSRWCGRLLHLLVRLGVEVQIEITELVQVDVTRH